MSAPVLKPCAAALYDSAGPLASMDAENGYALANVCAALCAPLEALYAIVMDDDEGRPGWSSIVDLDRAPDEVLDWLSQLKGSRVKASLPAATKRTLIDEASGMARGRPASIIAAVQSHLTGAKRVLLRERYNSATGLAAPGYMQVITYTPETPDPAAILKLLTDGSTVPGGIRVTHSTVTGQDWQQLVADRASWNAVVAAYPTWQDVVNH